MVNVRERKVARMRNDKYREMAEQVLGPDQMQALRQCVKNNAAFLEAVALVGARGFGAPENQNEWSPYTASSMDKVVSTLRQIAREWSDEGSAERDASYGRVIREIEAMYPDPTEGDNSGKQFGTKSRDQVRIVIPGCGLGRLPLELAARGFQAQGNEFSFHMLFTSHFLLNCTMGAHEFAIHPYLHSFSHVRSRKYQTRVVRVPNVHAGEYMSLREEYKSLPRGELSMVAGSFDDVYLGAAGNQDLEDGNPQFTSADIVATVFFIDTAPNIFRTLDTISKLLVTGGRWINFGPLLWHYEDTLGDDDDDSDQNKNNNDDDRTRGLELTLEDIMELLPKFGFTLEKHESEIPCSYTMDPLSMGGFVYKCEYWVAVKV